MRTWSVPMIFYRLFDKTNHPSQMFVVEHQRDETVQVKAAFNEILDQYIQEEETKDLNNALEVSWDVLQRERRLRLTVVLTDL